MKKKLLVCFVLVVLFLGVLPMDISVGSVGSDDVPGVFPAKVNVDKTNPLTPLGTTTISNTILDVHIEDTLGYDGVGTYTISTGSAHPNPGENVFYDGAAAYPWSTYNTIHVNDTLREYVTTTLAHTPDPGYTLVDLDTCNPTITSTSTKVIITWATIENIHVVQETEVIGTTTSDTTVRVTMKVTNNDAVAHTVGIRYEWDLMVDGWDGAWIRQWTDPTTPGTWLDTETDWVSPPFQFWEATNFPTSLFSVYGSVSAPTGATPPDRLVFAHWAHSFAMAYSYTPTGIVVGSTEPTVGGQYDSAVLYYWNPTSINPSESRSVTAYVTTFIEPVAAPIKIGVIGPMAWMQGQGMKEGAEIARDEINAGGGILGRNVELVFADTLRGRQHPDAETGATAAIELVNAGCDFVIGGFWSEAIIAAREVFMDYYKIFLITGAAEDELIDGVQENYARYKYLFRVAPVNSTTLYNTFATFLRDYILPEKLARIFGSPVKTYIVAESLPWCDGIVAALTGGALGPNATVVGVARPSWLETDFSAILQNVSASGARLLIHLFSAEAGTSFIHQWRDMGVKAVPVGINMVSQKIEFWEQTDGKCEYETILAVSGTRTPLSPKALAFYDETLSRYGHGPVYTSYGAYDAIYTLKEAIERAGTTDTDAVVAKLEQTDRISILGKFKFTHYHDVFCNEIGANWVEGYVRPLITQWQKSPVTGEARLEVVYPLYDRAAPFTRKWKIPTWIYSLAETDLNLDGDVYFDDLIILGVAYGSKAGDPQWSSTADIDGNGIINVADLSRLAKDWAKTANSSLGMGAASVGTASSIPKITQTSSTTTVYLNPSTINGTAIGVNNIVTVNLNINDAVDIYSWEASMSFNATLLECTGVYMGEFLQQAGSVYWQPGNINNTSGEITHYACSLLGNYRASGDGRLAYATFRVKAPAVSNIHLRDIMVMDYYNPLLMVPFNIIDTYTVALSAAQTVFIVSNSTGVQTDGYEWRDSGTVLIVYGSGFYGHAFSRPDKQISFNVTGPYPGFSNVTIPKTLIPVDDLDKLLVIIDDEPLKTEERTVTQNLTHYFVYFTYTLGIHRIHILKRPPVYNTNINRYYATIQKAINAPETSHGHKILAYAGIHPENVVVNKSVSLIGENKHNTIIDGSHIGTVIKIKANNVNISGLTIQKSGNPECGILVDDSSGNNISGIILTNNYYGIRLVNSSDNELANNNASNNEIGIYLYQSSGNNLTNNTMSGNKYNFGLYGEEEAHFENAIDESNTVDGKPVYYVKKASNTVYSSTNAGTLYLIDCNNVTVRNLKLTKNVNGIFLWNTTNSKIQNVTVSNNLNGIYLQGHSNNSFIYHNSFIGNTIQAKVTESYNTLWNDGYPSGGNYWSDHSITPPFIVDEYKGVNQDVQGNDGIIDDPKRIDEENRDSYPLVSPLTPPIYNLNTRLGYIRIQEAIDSAQSGNTIIVRNGTYSENVTINKSLTLIGIMGSTVINGTGTLVNITANHVTLRGFTIRGSGSTDIGILLSNSNNIVISENTVTWKGYGIWLDRSDSCHISGNTITNNTEGIHLESSGNAIISRNTLTNNSFGIVLSFSSGNGIHCNNITYNDVGIDLWRSSNNTIYHNNLINNTDQVNSRYSTNTWDDGYPSGGNHWSDYTGADANQDGIGDTPYAIEGDNPDNYPLMRPRAPQRDVAVVSVRPYKTVVAQGRPVNITITLKNQGDYTEKFNVTVYANTTVIQRKTITLTSESSIPITLKWDTTGFDVNYTYTISVNATTVPGETDTADNTLIDGWVFVTVPGDVDGNRACDILDIKRVKLALSGWIVEPNADLDDNGVINILDLKKVKLIYSGYIV